MPTPNQPPREAREIPLEPITFTFAEACSAVADVFEAIPETYHVGSVAADENSQRVHPEMPDACKWCAMGGLMVICGAFAPYQWLKDLDDVAYGMGFKNRNGLVVTAVASDSGRKTAIRMLRIAAGELPMPKQPKRKGT